MKDSEKDSIFIVEEEKPDHHYRTEIPNIVFDLQLSVYALAVYAKLKKIAGDGGYCSYGIPRLAKDLGISEKKVRESKKELSKSFELLNNLPLIKVTKRKTDDKVNKTDVVTISPIWRLNGDFYRGNQKSYTGASQEPGGGSPQEPGGSPQEPKEEPFKEEPLKTNKPEAPASALPPSSESVRSFRDELLNKTELTAPQAMKINTQFESLDDDTFKEAMEAFFVYAKEKPIGNLVATIVTALGGGKDGKPWKKTKGKSDLAIENKKRIHEVFGKYDYKSIKGIIECNVNISRDYIEFTCGGKGYLFQYKQVDFKEAINKFLKKAQIQITI